MFSLQKFMCFLYIKKRNISKKIIIRRIFILKTSNIRIKYTCTLDNKKIKYKNHECAIFDKLPNELVSYLYMFCSRMLNRIFRDVNGTDIVTINGKKFLTNTIIKEEFLHPQKLGATATDSNVFSLNSE